MTLTTHMAVGTAVASLFPHNPALGFGVAFLSHFVLDAIPHWDYPIDVKSDGKNSMNNDIVLGIGFLKSFIKICFDGFLGLILSALFLTFLLKSGGYGYQFLSILFSGAVGGALPDFLQLVYMKWRHEPLISLQKFHIWIHGKNWGNVIKTLPGIFLQTAIVLIVFIAVANL
jgi:hypothetical protein